MKLSILTTFALNAAMAVYGQTGSKVILEATSPLGTKFYSIPDGKGVVQAAQKALAAEPKNPDLFLKLAQAHAAVWQDREAVEACTRGLALAPKNAALLTERGHRQLP